MDNLFKTRSLTHAVNMIENPSMKVYNRIFRKHEHGELSDRLAFDVITGNKKVLDNLSATAAAQVTDRTGRSTVIMEAPRIAHKRQIPAALLNAHRQSGAAGIEMLKDRVARELKHMRVLADITLEFWAVNALKGKIYDSDMTTVLVDYGLSADHQVPLAGDDLWTSANSDPIAKMREFQRLITSDAGAAITGWVAFLGYEVMNALLKHSTITNLLKYEDGSEIAKKGKIAELTGVELIEDNDEFEDKNGNTHTYLNADQFIMIGLCDEAVDVPFAPVVDFDSPSGVGNVGEGNKPVMFFSKSWDEKDPSARWIKLEGRPLPVLQRPGAVVVATVV